MATMKVAFSADTSNFKRGVSEVQSSITGVRNSVNLLTGAIAAVGIGKLVGSFAGFSTNLVKDASKAAASFETMSVQLEVLTGSAAKAKDLLGQLTSYGATTPLEQKDLQQSTKTLLAFNIATEDVMGVLKMLGDVSMGDGQKLQSLALVFGQVSAAGRLMGGDVLQMINAGFNPLINISKRLNLNMVETKKLMENGGISADMLKQSFADATKAGGQFNGMLSKISGTTEGKLSNLADAVEMLKISFGTGFNDGLKGLLDGLNQVLPTFNDSASRLGKTVGELLMVLSKHLPKGINDINKAIESDGIGGAIRNGLLNVLRDPKIKEEFEKLGRLLIPKSLRESAVVKAGKFLSSDQDSVSTGLMTAAIVAKLAGSGPLAGLAAGASLYRSGTNNPDDSPKEFLGSAIMVASLYAISKSIGAFNASCRTAMGSLAQVIPSLVAFGSTIKSVAALAGIAAAGVATYLGVSKFIGDPLAEALIKDPSNLGARQAALDHIAQRNKEEAARQQAEADRIKADLEHKKNVNWFAFQPGMGTGAAQDMAVARASMQAEQNRRNVSMVGPDGKFIGKPMIFDLNIAGIEKMVKEMFPAKVAKQNVSVDAYRPFLSSLASIGGASAFTSSPIADLQKITNSLLAKIEQNTSNISATAVWG